MAGNVQPAVPIRLDLCRLSLSSSLISFDHHDPKARLTTSTPGNLRPHDRMHSSFSTTCSPAFNTDTVAFPVPAPGALPSQARPSTTPGSKMSAASGAWSKVSPSEATHSEPERSKSRSEIEGPKKAWVRTIQPTVAIKYFANVLLGLRVFEALGVVETGPK